MSAVVASGVNSMMKRTGYDQKIKDLQPESAKIQRDIGFSSPSERTGEMYVLPVVVASEQGFSYLAYDDPGTTALYSVGFSVQQAQVTPAGIYGQSSIHLEAAKRAMNDEVAFGNVVALQMRQHKLGGVKRLELNMLYGKTALSVVSYYTAVDGTHTALTIQAKTWTPGMWSGMEGTQIDLYQSDGTTQLNTNAPLIITKVNPNTQTITVSSTSSADITAIQAYVPTTSGGTHGDSAQIFFYGTGGGTTENPGLRYIANNSGTLFNINAGTYGLWAANTFAGAAATPTFDAVQNMAGIAAGRGLDGPATVYVSAVGWVDLLKDLASLRMFDSSYSEAELQNGAKALKFHSQNGPLTIEPHIYLQPQDVFLVPTEDCLRIGAFDGYTFDLPGNDGGEIFYPDPSYPLVNYRGMAIQSMFVKAPAKMVYGSNFLPSATAATTNSNL